MDRREFLKTTAATAVVAALNPRRLWAENPAPAARVVVVHGTEAAHMLSAGLEPFGGWGSFVKTGRPVALKVNAAWASTPEQGANTDPALVEACIQACQSAGAADIVLPENPCSPADRSFAMSGIGAVAKRTGARLYEPQAGRDFLEVDFPRGRTLQQAEVAREVLAAECLINLPVAKCHNGATLTLGLKNWMGAVRDRGFWHRNGLHQCIADFATRIKAHLTIVDANRIMVTNGPRGPGKLEYPHQLVFGTDPVAVDAYAATLFQKQPFDIPHIRIAHEMGIGCGDLSKIDVQHLRT